MGDKKDVFSKAFMSLNISLPKSWESYVKKTILPIYRNFIPSDLKLYKDSLGYLDF